MFEPSRRLVEEFEYEDPDHPFGMIRPHTTRREWLRGLRGLLATETPEIGGKLEIEPPNRDGDVTYQWTDHRGNMLLVRASQSLDGQRRYFRQHTSRFRSPGERYPHNQPWLEAFVWKKIVETHGVKLEEIEAELELAEASPPRSPYEQ